MYTTVNYKTKKELREAVARGETITYYQPGPFSGNEVRDGVIHVEGPHYPQPHRWYAACEVKNGLITKVK